MTSLDVFAISQGQESSWRLHLRLNLAAQLSLTCDFPSSETISEKGVMAVGKRTFLAFERFFLSLSAILTNFHLIPSGHEDRRVSEFGYYWGAAEVSSQRTQLDASG